MIYSYTLVIITVNHLVNLVNNLNSRSALSHLHMFCRLAARKAYFRVSLRDSQRVKNDPPIGTLQAHRNPTYPPETQQC